MLTLVEVLQDVIDSPEFDGTKGPIEVNTRSNNGSTPMHWMATLGDVNAIELLLSNGAFIDVQDDEGNTPLHEAVSMRHADTVKFLLSNGANPNLANEGGFTSYNMAKSKGLETMVRYFDEAAIG